MTARILNLDDNRPFGRNSQERNDDSPPGEVEFLPRTSGFSGAISLPLLPDLIQIYTVSMADGALTIRRGTQTGTIWFAHGAMVHAVCGELIGAEAVYSLLHWHDGQFSLENGATAPVRSITASWEVVLMEGCRRLDEETRAGAENASASPADAIFSAIEQALPGFLAAAILDARDGTLLAQRAGAIDLDFAQAGPLIAEMLLQQTRLMASLGRPSTLLDSLSILGDQVHLLEALPGGRLFCLAVAREGANLAVVRRAVNKALGRVS